MSGFVRFAAVRRYNLIDVFSGAFFFGLALAGDWVSAWVALICGGILSGAAEGMAK